MQSTGNIRTRTRVETMAHLVLPPRDHRRGATIVQLTRFYALFVRHRVAPLAALELKLGPKRRMVNQGHAKDVRALVNRSREAARRR